MHARRYNSIPGSLRSPQKLSRFLLSFILAALFVVILYLNENDHIRLRWQRGEAFQEDVSDEIPFIPPEKTPKGSRHFRDSLSPSKKYVTAFVSGGFSNEIISDVHLLQLASLTNRTPILPPFYPSYMSMRAGFLPFSEVFDIDRLQAALGFEILEWGGAPVRTRKNGVWTTKEGGNVSRGIKDTHGAHLTTTSRTAEYRNLKKELDKPIEYLTDFFLGSPDSLGCWSLTMTQSIRGDGPRHGDVPNALSLGVSWTPIPFGHKTGQRTFAVDLEYLGTLGDPSVKKAALEEVNKGYFKRVKEFRETLSQKIRKDFPVYATEVPTKLVMDYPNRKEVDRLEDDGGRLEIGEQVEPEEHVLCFDYLFYSGFEDQSSKDIDNQNINNAIETIGMDLHFAPSLLEIALEALDMMLPGYRSTSLEADSPNPFPPYIAIHSRRNDFDAMCPKDETQPYVDPSHCFTPLSRYADAVNQVLTELISTNPSLRGKESQIPIIIFSDEPKHVNDWFRNRYHRPPGFSEKFWEEVDSLGWKSLDHEDPGVNTDERWGIWYSNLIDGVLMSHAAGFVGTETSTFTFWAAKRVGKWWNGPVRLVNPVVDEYWKWNN